MISIPQELYSSTDFRPVSGSSLGIGAKSSTTTENQGLQPVVQVDQSTGEIIPAKVEYNSVSVRLERFALQSSARKCLKDSKVIRVNRCLRVRHKGAEISVFRSLGHKTACYGGLQTCASVWVCPVCAAKISERRKHELEKAIEQHTAKGGDVLLLTLTNPHYLGDKLVDVLEGQRQALVYFNAGAVVTRFNKSIGLIGQVRALEVTHGRKRAVNNGWHPHYHVLLFVQSGLVLLDLHTALHERWVKACVKAGLPAPSFQHGVRLDNGTKAAAYASKWGLESEMTKGHIKKATNGETPFDLLRSVLLESDKQAFVLFREFAETFKGKRQLFWSPGLKAQFDLEDITDEVLASQQDDQAAVLGTIELEDWQRILKADLRGEVLELARHGWEPVQLLLNGLRNEK